MSHGKRGALARSKSIDQQIDEERQRRHNEIQLLILGGASSGKSTFIKQLRLHKGDGFPEPERRKLTQHVYENLADALNILLDNMKLLGIEFDHEKHKTMAEEFRTRFPKCNHLYVISKDHAHAVTPSNATPEGNHGSSPGNSPAAAPAPCGNASSPCTTSNTSSGAGASRLSIADITTVQHSPAHTPTTDYSKLKHGMEEVLEIFRDAGIQKCFEQREDFVSRFLPAEEYFLQNLERLSENDYVPSLQDVLYIRKPTVGVTEHQFNVNGLSYRVIDVAGQRSQRKKWIHFFENVTAVIFFVSLNGFCESLEEDRHINSLQDSVNTFGEVAHNAFLETTDFILFLNKKDLFEKRLKSHSIKQCFPNYVGAETLEKSISFIKEEFKKKQRPNKPLYTHVSCAVHIGTMKSLVNTVLQVIIEINLRKASHPL